MGFLVDRVQVGHVFLPVLWFSRVIIILSILTLIFFLKVCLFEGQTGKAGNFKQKLGSVEQKSTSSCTGFVSPACSVQLVEGFI